MVRTKGPNKKERTKERREEETTEEQLWHKKSIG